MELLVAIVAPVWWVVSILLATYVASYRGQTAFGLLVGLLFGPFGVLLACVVPEAEDAEEDLEERLERAVKKGERRRALAHEPKAPGWDQ